MTAENSSGTRECPYCAETIKAKAIKCRYCGSDLTTENKATQEQGASTRFCHSCGSRTPSSDAHCQHCGVSQVYKCSNCGTSNWMTEAVCRKCGSRKELADSLQQSNVQEIKVRSGPIMKRNMKNRSRLPNILKKILPKQEFVDAVRVGWVRDHKVKGKRYFIVTHLRIIECHIRDNRVVLYWQAFYPEIEQLELTTAEIHRFNETAVYVKTKNSERFLVPVLFGENDFKNDDVSLSAIASDIKNISEKEIDADHLHELIKSYKQNDLEADDKISNFENGLSVREGNKVHIPKFNKNYSGDELIKRHPTHPLEEEADLNYVYSAKLHLLANIAWIVIGGLMFIGACSEILKSC